MLRYISESKLSKVISQVLAFILLFNNIIFPSTAKALTGGPSQPEFSNFEPAGSTEMVNPFTGDFTYNIPLLDVDGYPINIAYNSNPQMDQEASWVGLGWTLNAGALSRSVRGIPDDFNGDKITRQLSFKDNNSWGVTTGGGVEFMGKSLGGGLSAGLGVVYNNYKGYGYEFVFEPTMSVSAGKQDGDFSGKLNASIGVKASTQEGVNIYAAGGLEGAYGKNNKANDTRHSAGLGINIGTSANSRNGRDSYQFGISASYSKGTGKVVTDKETQKTRNSVTGGLGAGASMSANIPLNSQAYSPALPFSQKSSILSLDIKIGGDPCQTFGFGYVRGFISTSKLTTKEPVNYEAYGYLNEEKVNNKDKTILDFSRDKDGVFYLESPNMAITNHTYDMFLASAQGLYGAFRANRSDIGTVYDPKTTVRSFAKASSGEIGIGAGVNVGLNGNFVFVNGESGQWQKDNNMKDYSKFINKELSTSNPIKTFESSYFKFAGEKTYDNEAFYNLIGNDKAVRPKIEKITNKTYKTTDKLVGDVNLTLQNENSKTYDRLNKQTHISYLTADEANSHGLDKQIKNYGINNGSLNTAYTNINRTQLAGSNNSINHHLSEVTVLQNNGSRYVYGIPIYNRTQQEVSFNVSGLSPVTTNGAEKGLVYYNAVDATKANNRGIDNYFEKKVTPAYAFSYLLTSVLSDDYVDVTGDGLSEDDIGNYTKFNYSRSTSDANLYKWRTPVVSSVPGGAGAAYFNEGLYADKTDDKGYYMYGEKDVWYMHSIETKNYVAEFILNNDATEPRRDAYSAADENGARGSYRLHYLKKINLYAKKGNGQKGDLIKTVNFEYDYSLCPNVPNNDGAVVNNSANVNINQNKGKLTLKKLWFTYGTSQKSAANPYMFFYADPSHTGNASSPLASINTAYNPDYSPANVDRWGNYKLSGGVMNNVEFPYVNQDNSTNNTVWLLNTIYTPSGGTIKVDYENDDYAYVMEKPASRMFKILHFSDQALSDIPSNKNNLLFKRSTSSNNSIDNYSYLYVDITGMDGGIPSTLTGAAADDYFKQRYLKDLTQLYFKCYVKLPAKGDAARLLYEYVPGYGEIELNNCGVVQNSIVSGKYTQARIKLKDVEIGDKNTLSSTALKINPIAKAALQVGRMYLPKVMYPGSEPMGSNEDALKGLATLGPQFTALVKGINKVFALQEYCSEVELDKSFVRMYNGYGKKLGGGSRVSQIVMQDNWGGMTSNLESTSTYGQVFSYTTIEGGETISSGVASYEPMSGGDENSNRKAIPFSVPASAALNNEYFQEEPYAESFYPDAVVGYSKFTVRNLPRAGVSRNATGYVEQEFYTAKDYPVYSTRTALHKQPVKPNILKKLLKFNVQDKIYLSQGFVVKTNDMHGKPKSIRNYAEGQETPISGVTYYYKTKPNSKELDNVVDVLGPDQVLSQKEIGVQIDMVNDSRMSKTSTTGFGAAVNISTFYCSYYVPLINVWPAFSKSTLEYYSSSMTKVVQKYGILERTEAFNNNSNVVTKNKIFDKQTGDVLLTETNNQFDAPVYNVTYPAYWAYSGMGSAFINQGIQFLNACDKNTGTINSNAITYFHPGDEVVVYNASKITPTGNEYKPTSYLNTCWVIKDLDISSTTLGQLFFIDKDGYKCTTGNFFSGTDHIFKIKRSGRRNLQGTPIGGISTLGTSPVTSGQINPASQTVLGASATEFDEKWNMLCEKCTGAQLTSFGGINTLPYTYAVSGYNYNGNYYTLLNGLNQLFSVSPFYYGWISLYDYKCVKGPILPQVCSNLPTWTTPFSSISNLRNLISCQTGQCDYGTMPSNKKTWTYSEFSDLYVNPFGTNFNQVKFTIRTNKSYFGIKGSIGNYTSFNCNDTKSCDIDLAFTAAPPNPLLQNWKTVTSISNVQFVNNAPPSTTGNFNMTAFTGTAHFLGGVTVGFSGTFNCCGGLGTFAVSSSTSSLPIDQCVVNPYLNGLRGNWRVKKSHSYFLGGRNQLTNNQGTNAAMSGNIKADGTLGSFAPFWSYSTNGYLAPTPGTNWIKNSEVSKRNGHGDVLQTLDAMNRPAGMVYGYNNTLPVAMASEAYSTELFFDGFEDYNFNYPNCSNRRKFTLNVANDLVTTVSHTGKTSLKVLPGQTKVKSGYFNDLALANINSSTADQYASRPSNSKGIYVVKAGDYAEDFGPFSPTTSRPHFVASVWVKLDVPAGSVTTYPNVGIQFGAYAPYKTERSTIIDGWQKIDCYFDPVVASGGTNTPFNITLYNNNGVNAYFDDIRVHPFNSNMQSKVYDPTSLRLSATLDERNYATIYQYDEEGKLVTVRKETEKGILTINETRTGLKK